MRTPLVLALVMLALPVQVAAATMTFTGVPVGTTFGGTLVEDGISATGRIGASVFAPDTLSLAGNEWATGNFGDFVDLTMETAFYAVSLDVRGNWSYSEVLPNAGFFGYSNGELVASMMLFIPLEETFVTLSLEQFPMIDRLRIQALAPADFGIDGRCSNAVCSALWIDNVVLHPIPEPGEQALFALGLALVACATLAQRA